MIDAIAQILTSVLLVLYPLCGGNWGIAIIVLTLLVRIVIWPLTRTQVESMKKMQALQPQMKELEAKYGDDKEKRAQATMEIYAANKINPLSGCLPLLIQMPILIGMFVALREPLFTKQLPDFDKASFLGMRLIVKPLEANPFPEIERLPGMVDLASIINTPFLYDRFFYMNALGLFLLYIISSIFYSKMMQAQTPSTDPNQKMMSNMMMLMLMYFGLIFPVGLLLYFVMSNVMQMVQQAMTPQAVATEPVVPPAKEEKPALPPTPVKSKGKKSVPAVVVDVEPEPAPAPDPVTEAKSKAKLGRPKKQKQDS